MENLLGNKISQLRKEKGLTFDKLASITRISKAYLWSLEKGFHKNPTAKTLSKIAEALEVTVQYFMDNSPKYKEFESSFLDKFKALSKKDRERIIRIVEDWKRNK